MICPTCHIRAKPLWQTVKRVNDKRYRSWICRVGHVFLSEETVIHVPLKSLISNKIDIGDSQGATIEEITSAACRVTGSSRGYIASREKEAVRVRAAIIMSAVTYGYGWSEIGRTIKLGHDSVLRLARSHEGDQKALDVMKMIIRDIEKRSSDK